MLQWARKRAKLDPDELAQKLRVNSEIVHQWEESGTISIAQADKLALKTHTPVGFLYLPEPPVLSLPIPDFRVMSSAVPFDLSPDLLETVYSMQLRQAWMREHLIDSGSGRLEFVGACDEVGHPVQIAEVMTKALNLDADWALYESSWSSALRTFRNSVDSAGVLVVFNGVVGNNTSRTLDPQEFQGFALVDDYAPLVFVNSADFLAAQMFTLAHELAHIVIGRPGVSKFFRFQPAEDEIEKLCNMAAAEFLVPEKSLGAFWPTVKFGADFFEDISRRYRVSTIVAARRTLDLGLISRDEFFEFFQRYSEIEWQKKAANKSTDGNFWNTQKWRIGPTFGAAILRAAQSGRLSHGEAFELTGLSEATFGRMPAKFGIEL